MEPLAPSDAQCQQRLFIVLAAVSKGRNFLYHIDNELMYLFALLECSNIDFEECFLLLERFDGRVFIT